jgi:hypothetical protein
MGNGAMCTSGVGGMSFQTKTLSPSANNGITTVTTDDLGVLEHERLASNKKHLFF